MASLRCFCRISSSRFLCSDVPDAVDACVFLSPLGIGEPGIMFGGLDVLVGVLWLAEAWGASGAGPLAPALMGMWCSAWGAQALLGAAGGSTQGSQSIKLTGCSRAPAVCVGDAMGARSRKDNGALPTERHS